MKDFTAQIKAHLEERNWDNLRPADVAKSIMIEGAELLEVFQWDNLTKDEIRVDSEKMLKIKKEVADVVIYCFEMAVILGIDMEEIVTEKLKKVQEKYPAHLFKGETKDQGTQDVYWKIKEEYRRKGKN